MPTALRHARVFAAACLVVATLLSALPTPAAALEPPRPLPGYTPEFVTETDTRPWTDCLWASAAMLLDKWTNGDVRVTRQELRRASGDRVGGSSFDELKVAYAKYGFDLRFSPDGGARITWGQLLSRLGKGAGAILLGDYHKLPRYYGRWDYGFWKAKGKKDNHAVYIERYDRKRGRVWLMDPLGRDGWKGEWISVWALHRYAWKLGGSVYAALTPTAKAAPFAKVKAATPKIAVSPTALDASWTLNAPKKWSFPGATAKTVFQPAADPLLAAARSPGLPVKTAGSEPRNDAEVWVRGKSLHLSAPLPTDPGAYVVKLSVQDRRFGQSFVSADDLAVFIPGERRATMRLNVRHQGVESGSSLKLSVNVANTGTETWADTTSPVSVIRDTRVEARWIPLDTPAADAGKDATAGTGGDLAGADAQALTTATETLQAVPLAPGRMVTVHATVLVPLTPGSWALVIDVADDVDGSYAALGSAPAVAVIDVVAPRGLEPVD